MAERLTPANRGRLAFKIFTRIVADYEKGLGVQVEDLLSLEPKATIDDVIEILESLTKAGVLIELHIQATVRKYRGFTLSDGWTFERTLYDARRLTREAIGDEEGGLAI